MFTCLSQALLVRGGYSSDSLFFKKFIMAREYSSVRILFNLNGIMFYIPAICVTKNSGKKYYYYESTVINISKDDDIQKEKKFAINAMEKVLGGSIISIKLDIKNPNSADPSGWISVNGMFSDKINESKSRIQQKSVHFQILDIIPDS
jgi:hypothetical protein